MEQEEQEEILLSKKRVEVAIETRSVSWVNMVEEDEAEEARIAQQVEGLKIISPQEEKEIQIIKEIGNIKIADDQKSQATAPSPAKQAPERSRPRCSKGKYIDFKVVPLRPPGQLPPIKDFITPPAGPVLEPRVFTTEMREVAESVYQSHKENEYRNYDGDILKGRDLLTLKSPNWLNDTAISAYLYLIQLRNEDRPDLLKVFRYPAFFTHQLLTVGYSDMTDGWLGTHNIFEFELIFFPIGGNNHWYLAAVDNRENTITIYDSLPSLSRSTDAINHILTFVTNEHFRLFKRPMRRRYTLQIPRNIPLQNNGVDCGVFTCLYAEYLSRRAPFNFNQSDIPYQRLIITWELFNGVMLTDAT